MNPTLLDLSTDALLSQAANPATQAPLRTIRELPFSLVAIDWTIMAMGAACVAFIGVQRLRRDKVGGLFTTPIRVHTIREDAVLTAVLAYLFAALLLSWLMGMMADQSDAVRIGLVVNIGAQLTGIAACLWIASRRFTGGIRAFVFGGDGTDGTTALVAVSAATIIALAFCPLIHESTVRTILYFVPSFELTPHSTIRALHDGGLPVAVVVALWVGAAVITPAAEEIFFRGVLQSALVNITQSRRAAIVLAAAVFGSVHTPQPDAMAALVFLGVLLGYAYERTGALVVPIVIHAAFNLKTLIWDTLGRTMT